MTAKELDQFYTNPEIAIKCYQALEKLINLENYFLIEPSAGSGSFSDLFHSNSMALDIDPKKDYIIKQDFFNFIPPETDKEILTIGNPPFGKNSSLAIKFFNKSATFSKYIAFVIPKTFKKVSVINKLNNNFHLLKEIDIPINSFIYEGEEYSVPCLFQIWEYKRNKRDKIAILKTSDYFNFTTKENADFAIRRVGGLAGKVIEEFNEYSENSHYYIKSIIDKRMLLKTLKSLYSNFQIVAKNAAGNPSLSKHELIEVSNETLRKL